MTRSERRHKVDELLTAIDTVEGQLFIMNNVVVDMHRKLAKIRESDTVFELPDEQRETSSVAVNRG